MKSPEVTLASLEGWNRVTHLEEVWGTVVTYDVRGEEFNDEVNEAISDSVRFLHQVDEWFSR